MPYFMCQYCGCLVNLDLAQSVPPHKCPVCDQVCAFVNVTSYTPEYGGEKYPDPRIMSFVLHGVAPQINKSASAGLTQRTSVSSDSDALCREAAFIAIRKLRDQIMPMLKGKTEPKVVQED